MVFPMISMIFPMISMVFPWKNPGFVRSRPSQAVELDLEIIGMAMTAVSRLGGVSPWEELVPFFLQLMNEACDHGSSNKN